MSSNLCSIIRGIRQIEQLRHIGDRIIRRNEFGSIHQIDIPIERPIKSHVIKKTRNAKPLQIQPSMSTNIPNPSTSFIECSNPEFKENFIENGRLRLFTRHWEKNKYKNHWIKIKKTIPKTGHPFPPSTQTWNELQPDLLHPSVVEALVSMGCRKPTEMQSRMARYIFSPNHLFLAAETGSGKTLAYAAPILSMISRNTDIVRPKVIVLVSTTLLARQIAEVFRKLASNTDVIVKEPADHAATEPWNILVGTPGRIFSILKQDDEAAKKIKFMVVEEADVLLDESFADVISDVLSVIPIAYSDANRLTSHGAKVIFCSASCTEELECLAESIVDRNYLSYVKSHNIHKIMPTVDITLLRVREMDKIEKLKQLLEDDLKRGKLNQTIVFCKNKKTAKFVHAVLKPEKDTLLWENSTPKNLVEEKRIIIATDVASRGVDLPRLNHVIHHDMAKHTIDFLHRSGRVGRLSSLYPCRITAFVRTAQEIMTAMKVEAAGRTGKPLRQIETDIAGMVNRKKEELTAE